MIPVLLVLALAIQRDEQQLAAPSPLWHSPHPWTESWQPADVAQQIQVACGIDSAWYSLEREPDGRARVQASPELTSDQLGCASRLLRNLNIQDRDQSGNGPL